MKIHILVILVILLTCLARAMATLTVSRFDPRWFNREKRRNLWRMMTRGISGLQRQLVWFFRCRVRPVTMLTLMLPLMTVLGLATLTAARSPLYYQKTPGGMPAIVDVSKFSGNIFYVDSAVGTDGAGYGSHPDKPVATIDYAIGLCTANQGDVILVLPGHAETLTAAITCDIAGLQIISVGQGIDRAELTVNGAIDGVDITADDVTLDGVYFNEATDSATSNINIAAARATLRHVHMDLGANDVDAITITAAGEMPTFEDCTATPSANGPDSWIKFEGVIDRPIIRRNNVIGSDGTNAFDDGILDFNNQAVTNPLIYDNVWGDGNAAVTVVANAGNVVGEVIGINRYAALATNADTVGFPLSDGAITA